MVAGGGKAPRGYDGDWTDTDDEVIKAFAHKKKWGQIAILLNRTDDAVRNRHNRIIKKAPVQTVQRCLKDGQSRQSFSEDEDKQILFAVHTYGNKWDSVKLHLQKTCNTERTSHSIRNRYARIMRSQQILKTTDEEKLNTLFEMI